MMEPGKPWYLGLIDPGAARRAIFHEIFVQEIQDNLCHLVCFEDVDHARRVLYTSIQTSWILVWELGPHAETGFQLIEFLKARHLELVPVGMALEPPLPLMRRAMRFGLVDILPLPLDPEDTKQTLAFARDRFYQNRTKALERAKAELAQNQLIRELRSLGTQKDDALVNTAEELKIPLNSVVSILETLLEESKPTAPEQTLLNLALSSARRLDFVFQHLMANLGLKKDRLNLRQKPVALGKVVEGVLAFSEPLLGNKNLQLVNLIGNDLPDILADEECLEQIFFNLLRFAVTYARDGELLLRAEPGPLGVWVHFSITSSKLGAPHTGSPGDLLPESPWNSQALGKTLVLKLTEKLVKRLGGEWHPPELTRFSLEFGFFLKEAGIPTTDGDIDSQEASLLNNYSVPDDPVQPRLTPAGKEFRILVVDDDPVTQKIICRQLKAYQVEVAENGARALAIMDTQPAFDLIILDVVMPVISGLRLCKILRQRFQPFELPILLITVPSQMKDVVNGLEAGANDFLTKPVVGHELIARVKNLLELCRVHRLLKTVQTEVQAQAKEAGRSEFATTILHNVGNVLNSIHISCSTIADRLQKSKVQGFAKANALLQSNLHKLQHFLTSDERGKKLPEYYAKLSALLEGENEVLRSEIARVQRRIAMMGDIIETQQIFAKPEEKGQSIFLDSVIEESLAVHEELIQQQDIRVKKKFHLDQPILAQRALLTHVLVNLIKNGIEAMEISASRVLTLETGLDPDHRPYLSITDTGEGMADSDKIYQRGFTTKKNGHGYGLYFCRKAMESMGGSLSAESQGVGHGATFKIGFKNDPSVFMSPEIQ